MTFRYSEPLVGRFAAVTPLATPLSISFFIEISPLHLSPASHLHLAAVSSSRSATTPARSAAPPSSAPTSSPCRGRTPSPHRSSSLTSGRRKENLVIDIPTRAVAINTPPMNSPLPASRMPGSADEMRSPVSARLRSLRRLLSRGKQAVVGTSYSPRAAAAAGDIEQGFAGRPPKTPKTPN